MRDNDRSYDSNQVKKFTPENQKLLAQLEEENGKFYDLKKLYEDLESLYQENCEHHFDNRQKLICMLNIRKNCSPTEAAAKFGISKSSFTQECSKTFYKYFKQLFNVDEFDRNQVSNLLSSGGYSMKNTEEILREIFNKNGRMEISLDNEEEELVARLKAIYPDANIEIKINSGNI